MKITHLICCLQSLALANVLAAEPTAYSVRFDKERYDIDPGALIQAQVVIDPLPEHGLHSFGVTLSVDPAHAAVGDLEHIVTAPQLDFNGVRGAGSIRSLTVGSASAKGTVDSFADPFWFSLEQDLVSFGVTDLAPGPYRLKLAFFNTLGPTEDIFVDGLGNILDGQITFGEALVNYRPYIVITSPEDGAILSHLEPIMLAAEAGDVDGFVEKVEYYSGEEKIAESSSPGFTAQWLPAAGLHELRAVATDNLGAQAESTAIYVQVSGISQPYAIFAGQTGKSTGSKVINWNGNSHHVTGTVHSNSDIDITGNKHVFKDGAVEYVTGINPTSDLREKFIFENAPVIQSTIMPYPVDFQLADFAPGGVAALEAQAAGQYYHVTGNSNLREFMANNALREGLYYVQGRVQLSGRRLSGKVTIVATGEIKVAVSDAHFEPYFGCLLAFSSNKTADHSKAAISLSGSGSRLSGIVFAPEGGVEIIGADNSSLIGSLIGLGVTVSGSRFELTGIDLQACRPVRTGRLMGMMDGAQPLTWPLASLEAQLSGSVLRLTYTTDPGYQYTIESAAALVSEVWSAIHSSEGDGATHIWEARPDQDRQFFRLRIDPVTGTSPGSNR